MYFVNVEFFVRPNLATALCAIESRICICQDCCRKRPHFNDDVSLIGKIQFKNNHYFEIRLSEASEI